MRGIGLSLFLALGLLVHVPKVQAEVALKCKNSFRQARPKAYASLPENLTFRPTQIDDIRLALFGSGPGSQPPGVAIIDFPEVFAQDELRTLLALVRDQLAFGTERDLEWAFSQFGKYQLSRKVIDLYQQFDQLIQSVVPAQYDLGQSAGFFMRTHMGANILDGHTHLDERFQLSLNYVPLGDGPFVFTYQGQLLQAGQGQLVIFVDYDFLEKLYGSSEGLFHGSVVKGQRLWFGTPYMSRD